MESVYFINLIFIFVLNVFFFFSGVCLNCVVIISFWRSVQLRKKLCYFMIMVLSCCDLLAVATNNSSMALLTILLLREKLDFSAGRVYITLRLTQMFLAFSFLALFVMSLDRYLATSYPLIHRTSVTKRRLLTLLSILGIFEIALTAMSVKDSIISFHVCTIINLIFLTPPMLFVNYKLFAVVRKSRRKKETSPEIRKTFSLKTVSSCSLVVACFIVLSIPLYVYVVLKMQSNSLNDGLLAGVWGKTITSMNCTFNCLILFWKNKVLRNEGLKVIKSFKIGRGAQS